MRTFVEVILGISFFWALIYFDGLFDFLFGLLLTCAFLVALVCIAGAVGHGILMVFGFG